MRQLVWETAFPRQKDDLDLVILRDIMREDNYNV